MRAVFAFLFLSFSVLTGGLALGGERPVVVVELFTSQGCSSCPPADAFMADLVKQDDVLPLALHVDYWDYIGWKDTFARPENTARQKAYAYAFGTRTIYTPQMVIGGMHQAVGSHVMEVMDLVHKHQQLMERVMMKTAPSEDGGRSLIIQQVTHLDLPSDILVQVVHFIPQVTVAVQRGENAGRDLTSTNVVTNIQGLGAWNGKGAVQIDLPTPIAPKGQKAAILLQAASHMGHAGEILAAIELD